MDRAELIDLFKPLYEEAQALAQHVFEHAEPPTDIRCAYLVKHAYDLRCNQRKKEYPSNRSLARQIPPKWPADWPDYWHLPEPFNGKLLSDRAQIGFVGLNPSIRWTEGCPTVKWTVDQWIDYYLDRFDESGHFRKDPDATLYVAYQEALNRAAVGNQPLILGTHAFVTEIVHYKAKKPFGEVINRQGEVTTNSREQFLAAATHCLPWTRKFLKQSGVEVVVAVGREVAEQLLGPGIAIDGMKAIQGHVFWRGGLSFVTTKHPAGDWSWTEQDMKNLADGIRTALLNREDPAQVDDGKTSE